MTAIVIPARLASTRLPRKPLRNINGKPMIWYVYQGCLGSDLADEVYVATEDEEIVDVVNGFGGKAILTPKAINVLDRCSMAADHLKDKGHKTVVVVQGDEPQVRPEMIDLAIRGNVHGTCLYKVTDEDVWDPNMVKVLLDKQSRFVYLSRLPIPGVTPEKHSQLKIEYKKQVCIMAFETAFLQRYKHMEMGPFERAEGIDVLRFLEHGLHLIRGVESPYETHCVDTEQDLEMVRDLMR
jgi:3-deoxy-manno-octulosonate cytidylyltransferase (CMP-KDO synthetase)